MKYVSEWMRWLVREKQRFVSIEEGWERFLDHLAARNGADLRGLRNANMAEVEVLLQYVEDLIEDPEAHSDDSATARLEDFGRREDVIEAFDRFRKEEMLPFP